MIEQPLVVVVTVNWNTAKETLQCVDSVLKSDYSNLSLLVVDNGSRAEELALLRAGLPAGVKLLALDKNYGYVGGVNHGLEEARGMSPDYYLIMNNDAVLDPVAVEELVKAAARQENKCIVTGIVYDYFRPKLIQQVGSHYINKRKLIFKPYCSNREDPGFSGEDILMDMIDDVFWLLPKEVFEQVGFYCNHFWFNNEQADYALRAVQKGFKLVFTPGAKLRHKGSISIGGKFANPVREYFDIKSKLILRYKHMRCQDFAVYFLGRIGYVVKLGVRCLVKKALHRPSSGKVVLSKLLGMLGFTRWLYNQAPDDGSYPAILGKGQSG